jgi:transcriptional regulator GlxA family with amidase domain
VRAEVKGFIQSQSKRAMQKASSKSPTNAIRKPSAQRVAAKAGQHPELLRRLLRAKDRMDAASHEPWPIRRLARVSCVSEAHFARSFKRAFGLPPHRYLLTRRLERATALLRDTDMAITQIAIQTGWESLGTFGRTFRNVTGQSPGDVRAGAKAAKIAGNLPNTRRSNAWPC